MANVGHVLDKDWLVVPVRDNEGVNRRGRSRDPQHSPRPARQQVNHDKDNHRDAEQDREGLHDSADQVGNHGGGSSVTAIVAGAGSAVAESISGACSGKWQAAWWLAPANARIRGSCWAQISSALGQRVRNRQPDGGVTEDGSSPEIAASPPLRASAGSGCGMDRSSPAVYGWAGRS